MSISSFCFNCGKEMTPVPSSTSNPLVFGTPESRNQQQQKPNLTPLHPSMVGSAIVPSKIMVFHESPGASLSVTPAMPPPPPIRSTSSSSWFGEMKDPFNARLPAMKLALPSPTCPQTPNPPLQQRKTKKTKAAVRRDRTSKVAAKSTETATPRPVDVLCIRLSERKLPKFPGNIYYQSLIDDYRSTLVKHAQNNLSPGELSSLKRAYADQIVRMIRERDGRFLFKVLKRDTKFYDIGDIRAITKTMKLLQKIVASKIPAVAPNSPNPSEFIHQLNKDFLDAKDCGNRDNLEEIFHFLTIPSRPEPAKTITPTDGTLAALEEFKPPPLFPENLPEAVETTQLGRSNSYPPTLPSSLLSNRLTPLSLETTDIQLISSDLSYPYHQGPMSGRSDNNSTTRWTNNH